MIDEEELKHLYLEKKMSLREIGDYKGCCYTTIWKALKRYNISIRNLKQSHAVKSGWNKGYTKETHPSVMKISKAKEGKTSPIKNIIRDDKILLKIVMKQYSISSSWNLASFGYMIQQKRSNGATDWVLKEKEYEKLRKDRQNNPEKWREYDKKQYRRHLEYNLKRAKAYRQTERGKIVSKKSHYKRNKRGFIPLNKSLNIPFDWHHLSSELPFVMAIDRKIHKSCYGKKHYDSVNEQIGLNEIVGKSKEDIEYYIELNYPKEFKTYWFGNY